MSLLLSIKHLLHDKVFSYLTVGSFSGLRAAGAQTRVVVLRSRSGRRLRSGRTCPLLQGFELSLTLQSTVQSVPLQSGWVTFGGRNKTTAGPGEQNQG